MSWIFGYYGSIDSRTKTLIKDIILKSDVIVNNPTYFIAAGGFTPNYKYFPDMKTIVLGFGIIDNGGAYKWMSEKDWTAVLSDNSNKNEIEGHYLILQWNDNECIFRSDPVGLRTIYFLKKKNATFFSTKIEYLTKLQESNKIIFFEFGAKWLLYNKFSFNHFIEGIDKLPPGSVAWVSKYGIQITQNKYDLDSTEKTGDELIQQLIKLLKIQNDNGYKISFGLSGGLDSRFLLAILLKENIDFELHTFGYNDDPDVVIAQKVANKLGLKLNHIKSKNLFDQKYILNVVDYSADIELVEPISTFLKLETLNNPYFKDKILIDGALAEIARRQLLNKLVYFGKGDLKKQNSEKLMKYFSSSRPFFFKQSVYEEMLKGAIYDIDQIFQDIQYFKKSSIENFADMIVYKYKVPNGIGLEQTRLDQFLVSFMPFGQMKTFNICQSIPVSSKTNSKILYNYIDAYAPALAKIPLVKAGLTYPYKSSTIKSQLIRKYKSFFGIEKNLDKVNFYNSIKHIVLQTLSEDKIKKYKPYDMKKVSEIVNGFYGGNRQYTDSLDWLFGFELYRKKLDLSN